MMTCAALLSCFALGGWLYLAFFHASFWQPTLDEGSPDLEQWPSIDIVVPARNESQLLPRSLPSLLKQDYPGAWRIFLIDDHSDDDTSAVAKKIAENYGGADKLHIITAPELAAGWSGKVAAMQAGVSQGTSDYVLFTDADIEHPASSLRRLAARAVERKFDLVSHMVLLHCQTTAEKLLIPAFVFFFGMLYPFRRVNDDTSPVAAAAGGVIMVKRHALEIIGGLAAIKGALIDDCSLARAIKEHGGPLESPTNIELTLTRDTRSLRIYDTMDEIWTMIARTAYTQLRHSPALLAGTIFGMGILFLAPMLLPLTGWPFVAEMGLAAWLIMTLIYLPMIRFYDLPNYWSLTLPVAAIIYILATADSGRLYWQGKGGLWKGRMQA